MIPHHFHIFTDMNNFKTIDKLLLGNLTEEIYLFPRYFIPLIDNWFIFIPNNECQSLVIVAPLAQCSTGVVYLYMVYWSGTSTNMIITHAT